MDKQSASTGGQDWGADILSANSGRDARPPATLLLDYERTRCEIYTRVMGYHRPVAYWNRGKQQEHRDRVQFTEIRDAAHCQAPARAQRDSVEQRMI